MPTPICRVLERGCFPAQCGESKPRLRGWTLGVESWTIAQSHGPVFWLQQLSLEHDNCATLQGSRGCGAPAYSKHQGHGETNAHRSSLQGLVACSLHLRIPSISSRRVLKVHYLINFRKPHISCKVDTSTDRWRDRSRFGPSPRILVLCGYTAHE